MQTMLRMVGFGDYADSGMPTVQYEAIGKAVMDVAKQGKEIADSAEVLSDKLSESAELIADNRKIYVRSSIAERRG